MNAHKLFTVAMLCISAHSYGQNTLEAGTLWNSTKTECEYSGWALNTVFNLPGIRFNLDEKNNGAQVGTMEYFNSIGAGISLSRGKIRMKSTDATTSIPNSFGNNTEVDMKNIYGVSLGFLFSKSDIDSNSRIIFAPVVNLQLLDFQVGVGYELGDVANPAHRTFITVAYGLPLTKLINTGSFLLSKPKTGSGGSTQKLRNVKSMF